MNKELSNVEKKSLLETGYMWIYMAKKCLLYYKNSKDEGFMKSAETYLANAEKIYKKMER